VLLSIKNGKPKLAVFLSYSGLYFISWSGSRVTKIVLQQRSEWSSKLSLNYWWVDVSGINGHYLNIFRFESKSDLVMFHGGQQKIFQLLKPKKFGFNAIHW
jgi:hypothetical protein